jgi:hypothetical protein
MQVLRGRGVLLLLIFDLDTKWVEWSASRPGRSLPREMTPGSHRVGGWVAFRAGLYSEDRGKSQLPLPGVEPRLSCLYSDTTDLTTPAPYKSDLTVLIKNLCKCVISLKTLYET